MTQQVAHSHQRVIVLHAGMPSGYGWCELGPDALATSTKTSSSPADLPFAERCGTLTTMSPEPATAIAALTVDCSDAKAMVLFYRDAFGGSPDPDFPNLDCVRVDGLLILFREVDGWARPDWPGANIQMHLEICVDDLQQAEARLVSLGAGKPEEQGPTDPGLIVLTDPAGHPFCIFERPTPSTS
jgi:hypothetical protein